MDRRNFLKGGGAVMVGATVAFATVAPDTAHALSFDAPDPKYLKMRHVLYESNAPQGSILINTEMKKLYYVNGDGTAIEYPIAVGRDGMRDYDGQYIISHKRKNPRWTPTDNMRARNPKLPKYIEGGASNNPLGSRAIYFDLTRNEGEDSLLRAHGTDDPKSIGKAESSGCFRMFNDHVEDLYDRVQAFERPVFIYRDTPVTPGIGNTKPNSYGLRPNV